MTEARNYALSEIVRLATEHDISVEEIAGRLAHTPTPAREKGLVGRLFNYIGGIFVFSGICVLANMIWGDIGSLQRVVITFGAGLTAFVLAMATLRDARFTKAATPLFLVSALLQPTGMFVFLNEYVPEGGQPILAAMLVFAVLTIQHALAFFSTQRTSLLFLTLLFWNFFIGTAMDYFDIDEEIIGVAMGISMLTLSWRIGKTAHRSITPFWHFIGGATLLTSWWALFEGTWFDVSFLGLNAFLIYLSIAASSRTLLFVSVMGLLSYLAYFADEYFADVVGWPICLIVLGLVMMGLSAYAVKLGRKIGEQGRIHR